MPWIDASSWCENHTKQQIDKSVGLPFKIPISKLCKDDKFEKKINYIFRRYDYSAIAIFISNKEEFYIEEVFEFANTPAHNRNVLTFRSILQRQLSAELASIGCVIKYTKERQGYYKVIKLKENERMGYDMTGLANKLIETNLDMDGVFDQIGYATGKRNEANFNYILKVAKATLKSKGYELKKVGTEYNTFPSLRENAITSIRPIKLIEPPAPETIVPEEEADLIKYEDPAPKFKPIITVDDLMLSVADDPKKIAMLNIILEPFGRKIVTQVVLVQVIE